MFSYPHLSVRNGLSAGLVLVLGAVLYLWQLWAPVHQVELHSTHLIAALERNDWPAVREFLAPSYGDQWGHDRTSVVNRLREVLPFARHLRIEAREAIAWTADDGGKWRARVTIDADPNEVSALIKERVNALPEPFELTWRHGSNKPWDWKLVRVTNTTLELPSAGF